MHNRLTTGFLRSLPALALAMLAGCGLTGPATYELDEPDIEVGPGEEFTLSVPSEATLGERWYVASPKPDPSVVRASGEGHGNSGGEDVGAGGGTQRFDFTAVKPGSTKIKLIHCPVYSCTTKDGTVSASPSPAGSNHDEPTYHTYTVTVQ
ncbi:protease inhibitor I42 family protein [Streptomyces sp. NPDC048483]|uniref:protease inhibitor I42 family protein n=1 Tax=Streptomyces sp. NPDC048483 TaxID=3154927 RepID=UPI00341DF79A